MKRILFGVLALAMAATLSACPRDKDGGETPAGDVNTTINNKTETPPASTETPAGETPAAETPATNPDGTPVATPTDGTTPPADGAVETPPADGTTTPPAEPGKEPAATPAAEGVVKVVLETTKGKIVFEVHPEWAPLGAAHFLELVNAKYYDGAPWFRVIPGFVAQCGFSGDPALTAKWMEQTIQDEPVKQGNVVGTVAFGKSSMPNSRSTHIFINTADNTQGLDPQGFACFAKVIEGMDVALKISVADGNQATLPGPTGIADFKKQFPEADFITKAYVQK